jgi:hypothetical protein
MKKTRDSLAAAIFFAFVASAIAVFALWEIGLEWDPNAASDLAGYRIFHRMEGEEYDYENPVWEGVETDCQIDGLRSGTHFFVARAFDLAGNESGNSNEVSKTIVDDEPPDSPTGLTVK